MQYREYLPSPPLRRLVECFWTISSGGDTAPGDAGTVVPDGSIELVHNFADSVHRGVADQFDSGPLQSMVVGQLPTAQRLRYTGRVDLLGIRLWPHGAYPILRMPLQELSGNVVDLDDVLGGFHRQVVRELDESSSTHERIQAVEGVLRKHLASAPQPDPIAEAAVTRIQSAAGQVAISTLMAELGVSGRRLERVFERHVGTRPKLLCRVLRFRRAWESAALGGGVNWAALAARCGYYDQAHLIREFRNLAGASPTELFLGDPERRPGVEEVSMSDLSKTTS